MVVCAPKDGTELKQMLRWASRENYIVSIRYPRGEVASEDGQQIEPVAFGKCQLLLDNPNPTIDILFIGIGNFAWPAKAIADDLNNQG